MTTPKRQPVTDYPRGEILRMADAAVAKHGGPTCARVYFKFTCQACGARCTFKEPNCLYAQGECADCGASTVVARAGFALHVSVGGFP